MKQIDFKLIITVLFLLVVVACDQEQSAEPQFDLSKAEKRWNNSGKNWSVKQLRILEHGNQLYNTNCSACHLKEGLGQIIIGSPPLSGSPIVKGPLDKLIQVVQQGRRSMPAFGNALSSRDLAAVLSYVRNAWDNDKGEVVSPNQIARSLDR